MNLIVIFFTTTSHLHLTICVLIVFRTLLLPFKLGEMAPLYLLALTALITIITYVYIYTSLKTSKLHQPTAQEPSLCRSRIAAETLPNGVRNHLTPYSSRAFSNNKIKTAFGIKNAFTSADEVYVKGFVDHARGLVNLSSAEWNEVSAVSSDAVRPWISGRGTRIKLTSMVQALTMRVNLLVSFRQRSDNDADSHLVNLTETINRVWMESKKTDTIPRLEENTELQECLSAIFPDHDFTDPEKNPLNIILPGFETLWRVVFRMFLEIAFTTGRRHPEWGDMLIAFADNPTKSQFTRMHHGFSPEHLVNEALRLYPPTRRVYSAFKFSPDHEPPVIISANLEACHTAAVIWGTDAMVFNPARWTRLTSQQKQAFMPFGSAPFVCPAKPVFGPRVIALLVGALVRGVRGGDWRVEAEGVDVVEELGVGKLSNERGAYDNLYLMREV